MILWHIPLAVFIIVWLTAKRYSRYKKNPKILFLVPSLSIIATVFMMVATYFLSPEIFEPYPGPLPRFATSLYFTTAFASIPIQVIVGHILINRSIPSRIKPSFEGSKLSLIFGVIGVYIGFLLLGGVFLSLLIFAPLSVTLGAIGLKKGDCYSLTGLTLGIFLILFWITLAKAMYHGWT